MLTSRPRRAAGSTGRAVEHIELSERALELLAVSIRSRHLFQGDNCGIDHALDYGIERPRHLVVHPHTVAPNGDQAAPAQVREVTRDRRLRQPETIVEVTDADFVVSQQRED